MSRHTDYTPANYESPNADPELGPAMKELNPRQRAVVHYLLDTGKGGSPGDWPDACKAAGYSPDGSDGALRVTAHRLRHDPRLSEAIVEEGKRRQAHNLPAFLKTISSIGADIAHKDALKAALAGAAMVGVSPVTVSKTENHVIHHGSLLDQIRADCAILGIDADEFVRGRMKDVTPGAEADRRTTPTSTYRTSIDDLYLSRACLSRVAAPAP